jgi:hypothetical protein
MVLGHAASPEHMDFQSCQLSLRGAGDATLSTEGNVEKIAAQAQMMSWPCLGPLHPGS